jgi:hypothetical protein
MGITIVTTNSVDFIIPIEFFFWGIVAAYVIHILEESVLGEIFVDKVKNRFWPEYTWRKFFGFNALLMSLNIIAIILFIVIGGGWIIFPLALAFERIFNGFWHLIETIITRRYSSGLLSSILTWILGYFIIRFSFLKGEIPVLYFIIAIIIGIIMTVTMFVLLLNPPRSKKSGI